MCWDWLGPDTVLFCITSEHPEEETFCPAHIEEKHPNLPQWMTGNLSFRSQRRCMLGDRTPVPWLNFGQRSLPRPRFVGSAAHADALKPGVSGFVRHHLFVHKGRKSQRSTRHYLNQRSWARQDLNVLNVLGTLASVQMRIRPVHTKKYT